MNLQELEKTARPGAFSTFDMEVLVPEVEKLEPGQVYLEVGVDKGRSLDVARKVSKEGVEVIGVDIQPDPEVEGTSFFQLSSQDPDTAEMVNREIDVLFIDGDHTYEGCKADIDVWFPHMKEHGVMLFHDCDETSPGVVQAVKEFAEEQKLKDVYYSPNQQCSMARIRL